MPLVRIALREGKPLAYRRAIADEVHQAIVEVASVPELDRFQILTEHAAGDLIYDANYLGVKRTDDIVMIEITLNQRTQAVKLAIYKAIAERLNWWAELFEPPCVGFAASQDEAAEFAAAGADFILAGDFVWSDPRGAAAALSDLELVIKRAYADSGKAAASGKAIAGQE